jgi:hypothetical protein
METSRSMLSPPNKTAIFTRSSADEKARIVLGAARRSANAVAESS